MDAALALDGQLPEVDFSSRQPLYVYIIAVFLRLFGVGYEAGRLHAITFSLLTGSIVFLIARALFDEKTAILSATIYWILPLEVLQSAVVKTQPLVTFLTCLSVYAAVRFSQCDQQLWMIAAGGLAAMGFYVRETSLVIPGVLALFLLLSHRWGIRALAKDMSYFLGGYLIIVGSVMGYYSLYLTPERLVFSSLSPIGFLSHASGRFFGLLTPSVGVSEQSPSLQGFGEQTHSFGQHLDFYYHYVNDAVSMHAFLLASAGFCFIALMYRTFVRNASATEKPDIAAYGLLYAWVFLLLLAYSWRYLTSAFYIDYFREFLPPLVIMCALWLRTAIPELKVDGVLEKLILVTLCLGGILYAIQSKYQLIGVGFLGCLSVAVLALGRYINSVESRIRHVVFVSTFLALIAFIAFILVSRQEPSSGYLSGPMPSFLMLIGIYSLTWALLWKAVRPSLESYVNFIALSITLAAFVVSISYAADRLSLRYDNVWSPEAVEKIAAYLRGHTDADDVVLSGAVIWEFQARRKPFWAISHPMGLDDVSSDDARSMRAASESDPPKVIILDGYTEMTYFRQFPWLRDLLDSRYELAIVAGPALFPVKAYELKKEPLVNRLLDYSHPAGSTRR